MDKDERCCGTGTCMINTEGLCWCGQQWNGMTMSQPVSSEATAPAPAPLEENATPGDPP